MSGEDFLLVSGIFFCMSFDPEIISTNENEVWLCLKWRILLEKVMGCIFT